MSPMPSIVVDKNGTELAYTDSGPPLAEGVYTTIFAVHGAEFTNLIFKKVSVLCRNKGVRFVAINRREYNGSTPFSDAEKDIVINGTDADKLEWLKFRGLEFATFVDVFIQRENLPAASDDGTEGGVALLGWSAGATFTAAVIAYVDSLPAPAKSRFASHLRAHIMQEPPSVAFGLPFPPQTYTPQLSSNLPSSAQIPAFTRWITCYFKHGDLSTRDTNVLEYIIPATTRVPTIFNMSQAEIAEIIDEGPNGGIDFQSMRGCLEQTNVVYKLAMFDKKVRARVPHLKIWEITGDATASFALAAFWTIQDEDKALGGGHVNYKIVPGANHFMHWDDPEQAVEVYLEALS